MTNYTPTECYLNNLAPTGRKAVISLIKSVKNTLLLHDKLVALPLHKLSFEQLSTLKQSLVLNNKSARTIQLTFQAIKAIAKTAFLMNLIEPHELEKFNILKLPHIEPSLKGKSLTATQLKSILKQPYTPSSIISTRDISLLALMAGAGLRRSEVSALRLSDFSMADQLVVIHKGKGNRTRTQYLPVWVLEYLSSWLTVRGKNEGPLFCVVLNGKVIQARGISPETIYSVVTARTNHVLGEKFTPHDMRRTYISSLLANGVDISTVSKLAGHKSIITTQLYDKRGVDSLKRAVNTLSVNGCGDYE
ncbi:site-specific integrase [Pseudoalteromonas sp. SWYJZ98]|jgi:site-specific recombinase XerD|uniref:tyrosine-type recombinase/integrase n=1 Tax=Pseudoalteromonas sp. SWYJZ98 TaxID=2792060 RepID=UPI0018CE6D0C|nr:site-specific integrase [Pseudoalteromonas sp. SWYJZ98]MBH0029511.1 site-specific integrase [Pseudoalteromonas sp. SWYJZ98]